MKKLKILLFCFLFVWGIYFIFPYFIKVEIKNIPPSLVIYDENNTELWEIIAEWKYRHRNTKSEDIPEFLKEIFIAIEDRRFYWHSGIDYLWILRATKNNIVSQNKQWASTLENQIIRNQYWLNEKRSYHLKIKEFIYSLALNKNYSKDEILTLYLNHINFWYLNFWVESAAHFYYHKSLQNLTQAEMIGLLTLIKNPNKFDPLKQRKNFENRFIIILNSLEKQWIISSTEKKLIWEEKLIFYSGKKAVLPYVVDFIKTPNEWRETSEAIYTTINLHLTQKIDSLAQNTLKNLAWKNVGDYGILIVDKNTMEIKVMIGGTDYERKNGQVNVTTAIRQPWSTLKPFLYTLYFQNFWKNPSSTILDLPISYKTKDGYSYEPKNYSLHFSWEITLAQALSQSINVPAVKILAEIGEENFLKFLKNIWMYSLNKNADYYGLSLALWSGEISLYELLRAYSIFAKDGEYCEMTFINTSPLTPLLTGDGDNKLPSPERRGTEGEVWNNCKKIIDKKYTDMVKEILTNRYFKLAWFPIHSNLDFPDREVFVKTGTSRNFKDNWTVWFTNEYLIWVWVGNKDGSEMKWVSGATGAGDIFKRIVYELDNEKKHTPAVILEKESVSYIKITSPLSDTLYKFNPSLPSEQQQIALNFSSNLDFDEVKWYIDGEIFENNFLPIQKIHKKTSLKVEVFLHQKKVGSDEVFISRED